MSTLIGEVYMKELHYDKKISILQQFINDSKMTQVEIADELEWSQGYISVLANRQKQHRMSYIKNLHKYLKSKKYKVDFGELCKDYE